MSKPRLLDPVRQVKHFSPKTETLYAYGIRTFLLFHSKRYPNEMEGQNNHDLYLCAQPRWTRGASSSGDLTALHGLDT